jgi:thiol:disulfide interchange protein DsbD
VNPKRKHDEVWEGEVAYFEKKAEFRQRIKVLTNNLSISGSYAFQTCSQVTGQCLPPETVEFDIKPSDLKITGAPLKKEGGAEGKETKEKEKQVEEGKTTEKDSPKDNTEENATDKKDDTEAGKASVDTPKEQDKDKKDQDNTAKTSATPNKEETTQSLLAFMLLAFLGGFSAILTPCVFPMIPMTVTFFTKNKKKIDTKNLTEAEIQAIHAKHRRQALREVAVYAISIVGIYTILGVFFSAVFGAGFNNWLSTHWLPNLFFFALLVFFGFSFLGFYEIVLPSSWVNAADKQADKGGYVGIVFMAFTLALVSFSCTAPIVGTLLVAASGGAMIKPILGMIAFSSAVALPFALFAAFPSWLNSLPKSGGWLNTVKVTLGFLELAFSLKFLSQADLVYHWGILSRELFIVLWIISFTLLAVYLLGFIRFPHDSKGQKIGLPRLGLSLASFAFVAYLAWGLFGAPLDALAGYLPPEDNGKNINKARKYGDLLRLPHGIEGFFDLKEAIAYAKEVKKPIFIDFTGHGCVNCREMEKRVWSKPEVLNRLREDYVVVALYVDERKSLPKEEWYVSKFDKRTKKTVGELNADYQATQYNTNSQPYYCIIDTKENKLIEPKQYDLNENNFVAFLEEGKKAFQKMNMASK